MKEFTYENQGTNTYLVYSVVPSDDIDTMSLGMLTNNSIPGLASVLFTQMDTTKYIKYNVSAKISVKQFFSGAVTCKRLTGVFTGIVNAMLSAEEYMIDPNTIILDLDYIFADVTTCETMMICLPLSTEGNKLDLGLFFKNIMFSTQFDQTENCDYVAKIINYLNSTPVFSLMDFKKVLDGIKGNQPTQSQPVIKKNSPPVVTQPPVSQMQSVQPLKPAVPVTKNPVTPPPTIQQVPPTSNTRQQPTGTPSNEKQMSFFYLMQHYNAENAAKYKAQKATKKKGATEQPSIQKPQNGHAVQMPRQSNVGFAIPGKEIPMQTNSEPTQLSPKQPAVATVQANQHQGVVSSSQALYNAPVVPPGQPMNFGETTVLGGGKIGETTVLNGQQQQAVKPTPHLIREKNNEKIIIDKPVFRIGKEKSYVDYFIGDNTAISRSHANIISDENGFFITDTNSTNHTYVNGVMIPSQDKISIEHGAKIRLANENFVFNLY